MKKVINFDVIFFIKEDSNMEKDSLKGSLTPSNTEKDSLPATASGLPLRPAVFLDIEATGVDVAKDRIIEIAFLKVMPDGKLIRKPEQGRLLMHPQMNIPKESTAIHGITDEMVKDAPTFADVAKGLYKFLFDCDLAGFNSNKFDVPLLVEEFMRCGIDFDVRTRRLIDVQTIFHLMEERTLSAGYRFYCQKELENAHQAMADVMATYEIFQAQLKKYAPLLSNDAGALHEFCRRQPFADLIGRFVYQEGPVPGDNENKQDIYFNFGKYKGEKVKDVLKKNPSYYDWMMKGNFPLFTKKILKEIKENG